MSVEESRATETHQYRQYDSDANLPRISNRYSDIAFDPQKFLDSLELPNKHFFEMPMRKSVRKDRPENDAQTFRSHSMQNVRDTSSRLERVPSRRSVGRLLTKIDDGEYESRPMSKDNRKTKSRTAYYGSTVARKSFFSCHDRVLKRSGIDPKHFDNVESAREMRTIVRTKKEITNEEPVKEPLRKSSIPEESEEDDKDSVSDHDDVSTVITDGDTTSTSEDTDRVLLNKSGETARIKQAKEKFKKTKSFEDQIKIDPKCFVDYLKLVESNSSEYHAQNSKNKGPGTATGLGSLGKIYTQGHSSDTASQEGIVVKAAYEMCASALDPTLVKQKREELIKKNKNKRGRIASKLSVQTPKYQVPPRDQISAVICPDKSELSRARESAQKWLLTLTTAEIMKAREMALKEMGEEDKSINKWWKVHQNCRYIRPRKM